MGELRPAVFLDRDGTVVEERDYLSDPEQVALIPGAADAIRSLRDAGLAVVLVTNQSGIARGLYGERDYHAVQARLLALLDEAGAGLDGAYHCPHHPDHTGPCECRKPALGMYARAAQDLALALDRSWFVGDRPSDVEPAGRLGGKGILVLTGYGRAERPGLPAGASVAEDLRAAAGLILAGLREAR